MHFLEKYYENIIKHDLINRFFYKNNKEIPKLKKIVLSMNCKNSEIFNLASVSLFLELISNKTISIIKSKKANVVLKIRKGYPIGCKIVLCKTFMEIFLFRFINDSLPKMKNIKTEILSSKIKKNSVTYCIKNLSIFNELEEYYNLFTKLPALNITMIFNAQNINETEFLMSSLKIPTK